MSGGGDNPAWVMSNSSEDGATVITDLEGITVYKGVVKVVDTQGITAVLGDADEDFVLYGVYNGAFAFGPDDTSFNIDPASTATGSNFLPSWRFVQASNTNITLSQVRDLSSPSGSNIRFTFASGAANDVAYVEQITPIGGSRGGDFPDRVRTIAIGGAANGGTFAALINLQYLTVDKTIVGMPAEQQDLQNVAAGAQVEVAKIGTTAGITPTTARYLRTQVGVFRGAAGVGAVGTIDFSDVRRIARTSKQEFTGSGTWTKPVGATWVRVVVVGSGGGGGSGRRGAAGSNRGGGGGGGGGGASEATFAAADLPSTVTVTIGSAGTAGAAASLDNTDGDSGGTGNQTTFGAYLIAAGGAAGGGGTTAGGAGGTGGGGLAVGNTGGNGVVTGAGLPGASTVGGAGGGGGGEGVSSANVFGTTGGNGGVPVQSSGAATPPAGAVQNSVSAAVAGAAVGTFGGSGGGGGAAGTGGATYRNGAAGARGGGGGGGAASVNGGASGAGAAGGAGYCAVTAW